jgi:hypothetical protein
MSRGGGGALPLASVLSGVSAMLLLPSDLLLNERCSRDSERRGDSSAPRPRCRELLHAHTHRTHACMFDKGEEGKGVQQRR